MLIWVLVSGHVNTVYQKDALRDDIQRAVIYLIPSVF